MENFEEKLNKLEQLAASIRRSDVTLEEALKDFEQGITLAKGMEKELDAMESKIQILMNSPCADEEEKPKRTKSKKDASDESPVLDLFNPPTEINGTRS